MCSDIHIRYCVYLEKIAAGQEDTRKIKKLSFPCIFYICLNCTKYVFPGVQRRQRCGGGEKSKMLEVAYPHTCTHWLLLSAINTFPFVDAATP